MHVKQRTWVTVAVAMVLFALPRIGNADPPLNATVQFGLNQEGAPFLEHFPPPGTDAHHAIDSIVPRTVVIAAGGSVTFDIARFHQVAIYEPGTTPEDIDTSVLTDLNVACPPFFVPDLVIADALGRVALGPAQACGSQVWTTPAGTFDDPGKYLVICTTLPHFAENDMYGWVIVK